MTPATSDTGVATHGLHFGGAAASTIAPRVDALYTALTVLCGGVALAIVVLMIVFCVRYRRGSPRVRLAPVTQKLWLEITWTLAPLVIFLGLFAWGGHEYLVLYRPPSDALPVVVVARQWMWKLQHRSGRREINELHVPLGQPVVLRMTSQDVIHDFFVPAFRIKQDVLPGRYTTLSFTATRLGEYPLFCAEFCGSEHARMLGRVVVMAPADYARWLADGAATPSLAQYGFALFRQLGCSGCHDARAIVHAPLLDGLPGRTVHLQDGRTLVADDQYLRDSILLPRKDIVAGFAPVMPSFAGQVSEEQVQALVAYLHATASPSTGGLAGAGPAPTGSAR
jgi:cytochrome c oxidase subunit 2